MTNNATTKRGALVRVEVITSKLTTSYPTNGVDEVAVVEVLEPILIRVMRVGTAVEIVGWRIFPAFLITSVLWTFSTRATMNSTGTYTISLLVEHEGSNGTASVGTIASLATDTDSGAAPATGGRGGVTQGVN